MSQKDVPINFTHSIAASSNVVRDLGSPELLDDNSQRVDAYSPFKNITVDNSSGTTAVRVFLNGRQGFKRVASGVIYVKENDNIVRYKIENESASTAATVTVTLDSEDTLLSVTKELVNRK